MPELINKPRPTLTVLYDGACPLCRREIGVYQGLQPIHASQTLSFSDISQADSALPPGGVRSDYLARFHVQRADGQVISGAAAFSTVGYAARLALFGHGCPPAGCYAPARGCVSGIFAHQAANAGYRKGF